MKYPLLLMAFVCTESTVTAQFTATMKNVISGEEHIYKVYSDGENYRYEFTEDGQPGVVIVKPWKNQTIIMMPEKKYWYETTCDGEVSFRNDPVQYALWYRQTGEVIDEGEEMVRDYLCKIQSLHKGDRQVFKIWMSEKLNFPLKIDNYFTDNTYMELFDINSEWLSHKSYFYVLPDYTQVDENMHPIIPEPPAPEVWVSSSERLPFVGILKRGEKISIDIPNTGHYKIKVRNEGDTPTKYIYYLYENGEKLPWDKIGNDGRRTHRIFMDEKRTFTYAWEKDWQLVVEVYEGEAKMEVYPEESTIN